MKTKKTKKVNQIRQGDVLLIRREQAEGTPVVARGVRVPGERSGHTHVLEAPIHELPSGQRLAHVAEPTAFVAVHTETGELWEERHETVTIPAGWWEPVTQRQHGPLGRPVSRARFD